MERRLHFYVSRKNALTWLMALCLVGSAVTRIAIPCMKGVWDSIEVWSQIVLPIGATLLFVSILLLAGQEFFYKTTIPMLLMAVFYGFQPLFCLGNGLLLKLLYRVMLVFYFLLYMLITSGRFHSIWILYLLLTSPLTIGITICYWSGFDAAVMLYLAPELLFFLGLFLLCFAVRIHPENEWHPNWGDRSDGRRIRTLPPMDQVSPYIMVTRNSACNHFPVSLEISHIDRYIRKKRKEGLTNFGLTHVLLAAYVRSVCKYPAVNRFISGQKVYSRGEDIQFCMVVKKEMSSDAPDTVMKVHLSPRDTADDVYRKLHEAVDEIKSTPLNSSFDNLAHCFTLLPGVLLKFAVWVLRTMDYFGLIPKALTELSPFHGSVFFTSMGSLGIPPVYHHLYDFGNLPIFVSFGCKRKAIELQEDGSLIQRKYVDMKFVMDERIVDGYYYATFFKYYRRLLQHPEVLDNPPEEIIKDID